MFTSRNPYNGRHYADFAFHPDAYISNKIDELAKGLKEWRDMTFGHRAYKLADLAQSLWLLREKLAFTITKEMGKPYTESMAEVNKSISTIRFYAENHDEILRQFDEYKPLKGSRIEHQPLGVIFGIFPWNFPAWQVIRMAVPTILAGNVVLVKHAPNVPRCALILEEAMQQAGLGEVYVNIFTGVEHLERVVSHPAVSALSLTGSSAAGASFAMLGGKYLKKCVLELGGSDPFIVFPDADLDAAVKAAVDSRFQNNGQSCIAAKRFIVHEEVYSNFKEKFIAKVEGLKQGNPAESETRLSCLARPDLLNKLESQVNDTLKAGAALVLGGQRISDTAFAPTMLENIPPDSVAYREELFGPVASFFSFSDISHAVELANDTQYGLGATIFTTHEPIAEHVANRLHCGMVFINQMARSSADLPFGGIKHSGYGRELGVWGMREFVYTKLISGLDG